MWLPRKWATLERVRCSGACIEFNFGLLTCIDGFVYAKLVFEWRS